MEHRGYQGIVDSQEAAQAVSQAIRASRFKAKADSQGSQDTQAKAPQGTADTADRTGHQVIQGLAGKTDYRAIQANRV